MRVLFFAAAAVGVTHALESDDFVSLLQTTAQRAWTSDSTEASQMKTRFDGKCLDYNYNNQNVYMHNCHSGSNQQWYMDKERLKTNKNSKCLDMNTRNGNVYMHNCHDDSNQQWYFQGESLRTRAAPNKCLDYHTGNGNIYMHDCHTGTNQDFYYAHPPKAALASRVKSRQGSKCLDYDIKTNNVYFHSCHDGTNQKFVLDGTDLKSLYDSKCVDYNYHDGVNVIMNACDNGQNQQWHFDGENLKTKISSKCLDLNMDSGNVYMHSCHGGKNQQFYLENVVNGLEHEEVDDEIVQEEKYEEVCKNWCYNKKHNGKDWEGEKCAWMSCAGCKECSSFAEGPAWTTHTGKNCPGNNLDMSGSADQCFKHKDRNGWSKTYGADSNALCLPVAGCLALCAANEECHSVENMISKDRCYLQTFACEGESNWADQAGYELRVKVERTSQSGA